MTRGGREVMHQSINQINQQASKPFGKCSFELFLRKDENFVFPLQQAEWLQLQRAWPAGVGAATPTPPARSDPYCSGGGRKRFHARKESVSQESNGAESRRVLLCARRCRRRQRQRGKGRWTY